MQYRESMHMQLAMVQSLVANCPPQVGATLLTPEDFRGLTYPQAHELIQERAMPLAQSLMTADEYSSFRETFGEIDKAHRNAQIPVRNSTNNEPLSLAQNFGSSNNQNLSPGTSQPHQGQPTPPLQTVQEREEEDNFMDAND